MEGITLMTVLRNDWRYSEVEALYALGFADLLYQAQTLHREYFDPNQVQLSTLLSIKTGACPEDCAYCPQSGHYNTELEKERLVAVDKVLSAAKAAQKNGATRFCMGAAWRNPPAKAIPQLKEMIQGVKALGMETCMTLGMLDQHNAEELQQAGLDYYNHNLDSSPEYYEKIISTRTYKERLDTLQNVRDAGISVCCGGIVGMGEQREDRINFLIQLANLEQHPKSVPINQLIPIKGTPLEKTHSIDSFEFIRTIAIARIMMPQSYVRLSAGRDSMNDEMQALCFLAGANSIHTGDTLLTATNASPPGDIELFSRLGINTNVSQESACAE